MCGEWLGMDLTTKTQQRCVERDWTTFSKSINYRRQNNQDNWKGLYKYFLTQRIFALDNE
jgi:hypothetical protein